MEGAGKSGGDHRAVRRTAHARSHERNRVPAARPGRPRGHTMARRRPIIWLSRPIADKGEEQDDAGEQEPVRGHLAGHMQMLDHDAGQQGRGLRRSARTRSSSGRSDRACADACRTARPSTAPRSSRSPPTSSIPAPCGSRAGRRRRWTKPMRNGTRQPHGKVLLLRGDAQHDRGDDAWSGRSRPGTHPGSGRRRSRGGLAAPSRGPACCSRCTRRP